MMPFGNGNWGGRYGHGFRHDGLRQDDAFRRNSWRPDLARNSGAMVLAIIWLVRNLRKPVALAAAPVAAVIPAAPAVATHPCQKCGEPVQEDWKFCPHCGEKV